ncbi:hypothetical protein GCM10027515_32410 [Schumannella luteola]|uniref:Uncharacterized protein n=1 Tax=Schumannella luteola TaxID=472059 RepID=A0A852YMJ5_9MICO|nr:hypothetical protein [Schumannella luteola]NYG98959.1 hypothetical protein [Schumannella luteola]TPX06329.1 hypothetical protein FJ656_01440 [Schumannella luteola]
MGDGNHDHSSLLFARSYQEPTTSQELVAKSAGIIPLLQGQETVVAVKGVTGLKDTLDATYKFRFAALAKK